MSTSQGGAMSSKGKEQNYLDTRSALVHRIWGVTIDEAIPDAHNLRRPDHTSLGNNYVRALAALAEKVPDHVTAQKLMREHRDGRLAREAGKKGRLAPHLTVQDLQEILKAPDKKHEEKERKAIQEAFGLRKDRKPSFKAAETAEANKRQKTRVVDQENAVKNPGSASVKPAEAKPGEVKPAEVHGQHAINDQASVTDLKRPEHDFDTNAGGLPHPSAPTVDAPFGGEEDLDVDDLLAQYGLIPTDERSLIIGFRTYAVSVLMKLRTFTGDRTEASSRAHLEAAGRRLEWSLMDALNTYEAVLDTVDPVEPGAELSESSNESSEEGSFEKIDEK